MHTCEMHACEVHAYEMHACELRCTPVRCTPARCTPARCTPVSIKWVCGGWFELVVRNLAWPEPLQMPPYSECGGPDVTVAPRTRPSMARDRARLRRAIGAKLPNPPKPSKFTTPKIHQFATEFRAFYT